MYMDLVGRREMRLDLTSWLSSWLKINQKGCLIRMKAERGILDIGYWILEGGCVPKSREGDTDVKMQIEI